MTEPSTRNTPPKPLGHRSYGSIPHLPGSHTGPADHHAHEGQERICTQRARDRHDVILVQEKLDGACTAVARHHGEILPLQRAGYPAESSPHTMLHLFAQWVERRHNLFLHLLEEGERLVGEWLPLAHGTRYDPPAGQPWFPFDLMTGSMRATHQELQDRLGRAPGALPTPALISTGPTPVSWVQQNLGHGFHGAQDPAEGAVWRVERRGKVDFLAKWVRPDKQDGLYLPEISGHPPVWNIPPWRLIPGLPNE